MIGTKTREVISCPGLLKTSAFMGFFWNHMAKTGKESNLEFRALLLARVEGVENQAYSLAQGLVRILSPVEKCRFGI